VGTISACQIIQKEEKLHLQDAKYEWLNKWEEADTSRALIAFRRSCEQWRKRPDTIPTKVGDRKIPSEHWQDICIRAKIHPDNKSRSFFENYFEPYGMHTNYLQLNGLLTGYYEPLLLGSRSRSVGYPVPVWGVPRDYVKGALYPMTRQQIDKKGLYDKAQILLWLSDPVELFFLQVQGSGRVKLDDGTVVGLQFAAKTGHPYVAIGKVLIERGELTPENVSMQSIKQWLHDHPDQMQDVMWKNPSYVFFNRMDRTNGPVGAQGVVLTAEGSMAVDPAYIPYGVPVWVDTEIPRVIDPEKLEENRHPHDHTVAREDFRRLLIAQDTGSAIKGPLRGDIFFGHGNQAGLIAGQMKRPGFFTLLLPRPPRS